MPGGVVRNRDEPAAHPAEQLIAWSDRSRKWSTVGVSSKVVEASWIVLLDAIRSELMRLVEKEDNAVLVRA